jgi:hypothetical protein
MFFLILVDDAILSIAGFNIKRKNKDIHEKVTVIITFNFFTFWMLPQ